MKTQPDIMIDLVNDFREMLAGGSTVTELLARGYSPQVVEAAALQTNFDDIVERDSHMPKSVVAVREAIMVF
jgi:hypothetical protein